MVGGSNDREGRLEIRRNGHFGTVCDDFFGANEASVACYMLGYGYSDRNTCLFSINLYIFYSSYALIVIVSNRGYIYA